MGHAFVNTLLYLDYDRKGFDYPVIPFSVNCYGSNIIRNQGGPHTRQINGVDMALVPPGPSPKRCMELGAATARALSQPLEGGPNRIIQLVPRLPHAQELVALP